MSSAAQGRAKKPRLASETLALHADVDDSFTLPLGIAAQWLNCTPAAMRRLVQYSQMNAEHGIDGPLKVSATGQSVTLTSVFAYRRQRAAAHRVTSF